MRFPSVLAFTLAFAGAAMAQNAAPADANVKSLNVTANFQVRITVDSAASTSDIAKILAQASQSLGDLANGQCDALAAAFKSECRVAQLNLGSSVNEQRFAKQVNGETGPQRFVNANLNATFELTPGEAKPQPAGK